MQLLQPFNPANYDPSQSASQLPVGKHPVIIDGAEITATKANDGGMLVLNLTIVDGPMKGATGVYRLNLYNQSQVACDIAHKQLSAICHVTGMAGVIITDPQQLFNKPFYIEVNPQKNNPEYTQVTKVFDMAGNEAGKAPVQAQQPPAGFGQQAQAPPNAFQQPPTPGGGFGQPTVQAQAPPQGFAPPTPELPQQPQAPAPWPTQPAQGFAPPAPAPATANGAAPWLQNK